MAVYDITNKQAVSWAVMYNIVEDNQDKIDNLERQITELKSKNSALSTVIKNIKNKLTDLLNQL